VLTNEGKSTLYIVYKLPAHIGELSFRNEFQAMSSTA